MKEIRTVNNKSVLFQQATLFICYLQSYLWNYSANGVLLTLFRKIVFVALNNKEKEANIIY